MTFLPLKSLKSRSLICKTNALQVNVELSISSHDFLSLTLSFFIFADGDRYLKLQTSDWNPVLNITPEQVTLPSGLSLQTYIQLQDFNPNREEFSKCLLDSHKKKEHFHTAPYRQTCFIPAARSLQCHRLWVLPS